METSVKQQIVIATRFMLVEFQRTKRRCIPEIELFIAIAVRTANTTLIISVSHQYNTTRNIIVLYVLMFRIFKNK
jgi:hypothetical protein